MNEQVNYCVSVISTLVLPLLFSPSIALAREEQESIRTDIFVQTADTIPSQPMTELEMVLDSIEPPLELVHSEVVRSNTGADWTLRFQTTLLFLTGG